MDEIDRQRKQPRLKCLLFCYVYNFKQVFNTNRFLYADYKYRYNNVQFKYEIIIITINKKKKTKTDS